MQTNDPQDRSLFGLLKQRRLNVLATKSWVLNYRFAGGWAFLINNVKFAVTDFNVNS